MTCDGVMSNYIGIVMEWDTNETSE